MVFVLGKQFAEDAHERNRKADIHIEKLDARMLFLAGIGDEIEYLSGICRGRARTKCLYEASGRGWNWIAEQEDEDEFTIRRRSGDSADSPCGQSE